MIKEVLVVEGKMDVAAIHRALDADCLITGGFSLNSKLLEQIEAAYQKRGIIIFTDPDSAGERIRRFLTKKFPEAKHAFIPREEASTADDIGIENASPESIREALSKVKTVTINPEKIFTMNDLILNDLNGSENASENRAKIGKILGIGFATAKTFLHRLNNYGVTRSEFEECLKSIR